MTTPTKRTVVEEVTTKSLNDGAAGNEFPTPNGQRFQTSMSAPLGWPSTQQQQHSQATESEMAISTRTRDSSFRPGHQWLPVRTTATSVPHGINMAQNQLTNRHRHQPRHQPSWQVNRQVIGSSPTCTSQQGLRRLRVASR